MVLLSCVSKERFLFHKVECKQSSILFSSAETGHEHNGSGETINNATLLVPNFLALRVPRACDRTTNNILTTKCRQHGQDGTVCCGSDHFDNLIQYSNENSLDYQERLDIQRSSRALWNQRKAINKTSPSDIIRSSSELEDQLEADLRRFRANNFGVTDSMVRVVSSAVYPLVALLNHSCAPNCLLRYDLGSSSVSKHEPPVMEIVAAREISKGEELTHSYVELVSPMHSRRASLRDIFRFDCQCLKCSCLSHTNNSCTAADKKSRFQISLPHDHGSLSPTELSRWVLQHYNPSNPNFGRRDNSFLAFVDKEMILQQRTMDKPTYKAMVEAANAKQQQAQYFMVTGNLDGELASLKEAILMYEALLAQASNTYNPPLSLELYKARCTRFGSLIVAGGEIYSEEAQIECEHIVSYLCLALRRVPNHSLLGLQLFTLGDVYEANGERNKARTTYIWAKKILQISQGNKSDMVMLLNEKLG